VRLGKRLADLTERDLHPDGALVEADAGPVPAVEPQDQLPLGHLRGLIRSSTFPICVHVTRSRPWKIGTAGKYSKEETAR
jgi:hypothetical protein